MNASHAVSMPPGMAVSISQSILSMQMFGHALVIALVEVFSFYPSVFYFGVAYKLEC
jgi:hypothetical protein